MQFKIKDKAKYILSKNGYWVRNFFSDIGDYKFDYYNHDIKELTNNEIMIKSLNIPSIDKEIIRTEKIAIISSGTDIENCRNIIKKLINKKYFLLGVNDILNKGIFPNYYINCDTTNYCIRHIPKKARILPQLIVSSKSCAEFVKLYKSKGSVYYYIPTMNSKYNLKNKSSYTIDDYRDPICAAINFASRWSTDIVLISPQNFFKEMKDGMEKIDDNKYIYPQQKISHYFADSLCYWAKEEGGCDISVVSTGMKYENANNLSIEQAEELYG